MNATEDHAHVGIGDPLYRGPPPDATPLDDFLPISGHVDLPAATLALESDYALGNFLIAREPIDSSVILEKLVFVSL